MIDIINLVLPYFGLIAIGFACGKRMQFAESGLYYMNIFLLYVALPALFFRIMARTPLAELNNPPFILTTTLATALAYGLGYAVYWGVARGNRSARDGAIAGLGGGYGNIGYMGPGLALAALGSGAAAPVALIFCFDNIFLFSIVPLLIALSDKREHSMLRTLLHVARAILFNPLIFASILGTLAAAFGLKAPLAVNRMLEFLQGAAAPVALFALGVTVALRPFERMAWELPSIIAVKLVAHPMILLGLIALIGPFSADWTASAVLMASLPPALSVYVIGRQYEAWVAEASSAVLIGTLLSVITLPLILLAIRAGALPVPVLP